MVRGLQLNVQLKSESGFGNKASGHRRFSSIGYSGDWFCCNKMPLTRIVTSSTGYVIDSVGVSADFICSGRDRSTFQPGLEKEGWPQSWKGGEPKMAREAQRMSQRQHMWDDPLLPRRRCCDYWKGMLKRPESINGRRILWTSSCHLPKKHILHLF